MKHILPIFLALFLIVSCGPPEFEKNTRILVKGKVIDENENPIPDINIDIYTERYGGLSGDRNYLLGSGFSEQDGSFSIISLFDRDEEFQIEIYGEASFSKYYYIRDTKNHPKRNFLYDLKTIKLQRLAQVNYNITRTSPSNTELKYAFQYQNTDCFQVFDDEGLNLQESSCKEEVNFNRLLTENRPETSASFTTLLGSTVKFTYTINDAPEMTETFIIDKENYEFNFSY